jgi:hypothetical protein
MRGGIGMSEPVVFISHFTVREGKLEDLKRLAGEVEQSLWEDKPRTAAWLIYLEDGGPGVSFVHCFPDADAMDLHFEGSDERTAAVYEFIEPTGFEIYGRPGEQALETMREAAIGSGVSLSVQPGSLGGFLRVQPA